MSWVFAAMTAASLLAGLLTGSVAGLSAALFRGAQSAVTLSLSLAGALCLWSGILRVTEETGISGKIAELLRPVLCRLYPTAFSDPEAAAALSGNVTANLLGLGNAATPLGIRAIRRLHALSGSNAATDEMCRLIVMNTASIQLLPTTAAALRSSLGSERPFSILPAVLVTSLLSVSAGLLAARLMEGRHG